MSDGFDVAIAGATGAVGEALVEILEERNFPVRNLHLLASERSEGKRIQFRGSSVMVKKLDQFDFNQVQIGLFSAGGDLSAEFAPKAAAAGCVVIDNTSCFRYDEDVPLVVPEVNPQCVAEYRNRNIIANPNCSTIRCWWRSSPCTTRLIFCESTWPPTRLYRARELAGCGNWRDRRPTC